MPKDKIAKISGILGALCAGWLALAYVTAQAATLAASSVTAAAADPASAGSQPWAWVVVLPPVVAVLMAVITRHLLGSLCAGVVTGAVIAGAGDLPATLHAIFGQYLWEQWADPFHLSIALFTAMLLGMVHVATRSGGTHGLIRRVLDFANTRRRARVTGALMGTAIFFDDYANTAVVGPTLRPLFDHMRVSREKLAYIIDSTAAPVAGIAIVSTWVGVEVGYLQDAARTVGVETSGYALFFNALSYRFYCIFALAIVFVFAFTGRDFGPMLAAERRAARTGEVLRPGSTPLSGATRDEGPKPGIPLRWQNVVIPVVTVLVLILTGVFMMGAGDGPVHLLDVFRWSAWLNAFVIAGDLADGNALAYLFAASAAAGTMVAIAMPARQGVMSVREGIAAWVDGVRAMLIAFVILGLAWALSAACKDVGTADYVVRQLDGVVGAAWVPLGVFLASGLVAFATGTSWGTMAIMIPLAGPLGFEAGGELTMVVAMAAVLDGAIFGDHCSPISDTTVLASMCASSDHMDHLKTQAPYALLGCGLAALCGYTLVGAFDWPLSAGYGLGLLGLIGFAYVVGKPTEVGDEATITETQDPPPSTTTAPRQSQTYRQAA